MNILEIKNVSIEFALKKGILRACDNVSIDIKKGEVLGIIGESGSGKSTLASGILNLISSPGKLVSGEVWYYENNIKTNLLNKTPEQFNEYRWEKIATVFQAAQNALNPVIKIKEHFIETAFAHNWHNETEIIKKSEQVLEYVRLDANVLEAYPHQLSGGMKQRVLIALSLLLDPEIIILDEPTTALDVITQWYIIDILHKINKELGITLIFCTHDIAVISKVIDRIAVMYGGQIVEYGNVKEVFTLPMHPYTQGLLKAIPTLKDNMETRQAIAGAAPNLLEKQPACRFSPRCSFYKEKTCSNLADELYVNGERASRCPIGGIV
ncbi:dipeptide/oligopeptide/nickel ABC transporter ATP-binding protein [Candidatus Epulonipiscium fishelsonii]|uniref:Dipeptide/oligopeptide/nickel ABC transporter ATP-binding protein n=1 Tax=Candidatus Epulonipiscium fishelsonii TaxID=77094 RepID=A0ACC8X9B0_9FIRM|nr:dipeptide/oligopeptide/nickel ABC transporter ATP-binding protein [Epulopiscium sp. SCG-B11WGA-EpuloA1]